MDQADTYAAILVGRHHYGGQVALFGEYAFYRRINIIGEVGGQDADAGAGHYIA